MDVGLMLAFWAISLLLAFVPGADWSYAIGSGAQHRGNVVPAVSGMLTGHFAVTLLVAAGAAAVLTASPTAMIVLTTAGALYLLWLGIQSLRHPVTVALATGSAPTAGGRLFAKGIGISMLNPKVILLIMAMLPQFTSDSAPWPVGAQLVVLGLLHVMNCAVVYFAVAYGASAVLMSRPRAAKLVGAASAVVMILLGTLLMGEQVVELVAQG